MLKIRHIAKPKTVSGKQKTTRKDNDNVDRKIETYSTLWNLVDIDQTDHKLKDIATLFLNAMNDWTTFNQTLITDFVKELKDFFGSPLTIEKIDHKKHELTDELNVWRHEAGSSIAEIILISTQFCNESSFDKILQNTLTYYEEEFSKTDFIAQLKYTTTENGGRKAAVHSGYRPQMKFDFDEMQTSGQQTFIDKEIVLPGETVTAKIKIVSPDFFAGRLTEGMNFEFREGATIIGTGKIKHIINDKLEFASH